MQKGQRWMHMNLVMGREGPLQGEGFNADAEGNLKELKEARILVIGAGGLGCDIVKCLALSGFQKIDIIDMDTIDASNLNRQFLFRASDVGQPKASAAAKFINGRCGGVQVTPHCCKIQEKEADFYRQFQLIICGLDNVAARRWINSLVHALLEWEEDEEDDEAVVDISSIVQLIDSGTEGMKGNIRVIIPSFSSCLDCALELFPPPVGVPLCTIAATPRNAAHCIQYAGLLAWDELQPFKSEQGDAVNYDTDNPQHMQWITDMAAARAREFDIREPVTLKKTLGVIKNIIPAIASTNALIAAAACNEAVKALTSVTVPLSNYMLFNAEEGTYAGAQELSRNERCAVCSDQAQVYHVSATASLRELLDELLAAPQLALSRPRLLCGEEVLYMTGGPQALRSTYEENLRKSVGDIFKDGDMLTVSDDALGRTLSLILTFR